MRHRPSSVLIVIATYNERENLLPLARKICQIESEADLLIVDDNSPDGTGLLADSLASENHRVKVLHRPVKEGLGPALTAAFRWALARSYDRILNMDGDFSHAPEDIPGLLKAAERADVAIGSRYFRGIRVVNWPVRRLLLSVLAAKYVKAITGLPVDDPTSGFRCFRRDALLGLDLDTIKSKGYFFHVETLSTVWRRGLRIEEYPITYTDRTAGQTKISARIILEAALRTWPIGFKASFTRPLPAPMLPVNPAPNLVPSDNWARPPV